MALALLAVTGCVSRVHTLCCGPPGDRAPAARPVAAAVPPPAVRMDPIGRQGGYELHAVVMPAAGCDRWDEVTATLHLSTVPGRHGLVIVLPIWGQSTYPQRQAVRRLTRPRTAEPIHVLEVHGERVIFDWPALADAPDEALFLERAERVAGCVAGAATDARRLAAWARRLDGVDPGRVGIVGFSIGAVAAALALGQDPQLAAGVLVMGGADLHDTFASCRGRARWVRETVTRRFGWTRQEFRRALVAPLAAANPARVAAVVDPERVLIVDAAYDNCMTPKGSNALWQALGQPERITLSYGHKVAFLSMTPLGLRYTTRRIAAFLDRRLRT